MTLLINATNRLGGGGLQVAISTIKEISAFRDNNNYYFVINTTIAEEIKKITKITNKYYVIKEKKYSKITKELKKIEKLLKPDVIFSVFAPTYWRPKTLHLAGFANPYYFRMKDKNFSKLFSKRDLLIIRIKKIVHTFFINRDVDAIIAETEYCTNEFLNLFKKVKYGFTVSNTCSNFFVDSKKEKELHSDFRLLTVSKYYKHKNLEIINSVSKILRQRNIIDIKFVVTLDNETFQRLFSDNEYVVNKGYVSPIDCPTLYNQVDAMFLPTLAECFSASYPEAMIMRIPILTSDLTFAHDICNDSAVYFDPFNPNDIVEKIIEVKNNHDFQQEKIEKGIKLFSSFPNATERATKYVQYCEEFVANQKNQFTKFQEEK